MQSYRILVRRIGDLASFYAHVAEFAEVLIKAGRLITVSLEPERLSRQPGGSRQRSCPSPSCWRVPLLATVDRDAHG